MQLQTLYVFYTIGIDARSPDKNFSVQLKVELTEFRRMQFSLVSKCSRIKYSGYIGVPPIVYSCAIQLS